MTEREKVQKAFNQCTDALSLLDHNSVLKVFHLLSVQFDVVPTFNSEQKLHFPNVPEANIVQAEIESPKQNLEEGKEAKKVSAPKKVKSQNSKSPVFLPDFDFRPAGKESLKDFIAKFELSSNMEKNLAFTYYLQNILDVPDISVNHIFSCYRHLGYKIPLLPQTLFDTKARKGWIDTANINNIKITREGINFLEHELIKELV